MQTKSSIVTALLIVLVVVLSISFFTSRSSRNYTSVDRPAQEGDQVVIDFSGTVVGETEPFDGGTAKDYPLVLGSDTFIPGFEDAIIGHSAGETFEFTIPFPDDYPSEDLAGKDVVWTVTVDDVKEK